MQHSLSGNKNGGTAEGSRQFICQLRSQQEQTSNSGTDVTRLTRSHVVCSKYNPLLLSRLRPKTISKVHQERLASREHLQAVVHMTNLLSVELVRPHVGLKGADPSNKLARLTYGKYSFLCHTETGRAEWEQISTDIMRLVLQADQGGPLYAAYQFLAGKGYPVAFSRDEVFLDGF